MPLYDYACRICPHSRRADMRRIADRYQGPTCYTCGLAMALVISPVRGTVKDPAVPKRPK